MAQMKEGSPDPAIDLPFTDWRDRRTPLPTVEEVVPSMPASVTLLDQAIAKHIFDAEASAHALNNRLPDDE